MKTGKQRKDQDPQPPHVSVVIPHLNEGENLHRCLKALAAQNPGFPFEIIVVDNGSRELPEAVCAAFQNVRLVCQPIPGPGPARNLGASAARGEILAFIDSDCFAEPGWIAAIANEFATRPEIGFAGGNIGVAPGDTARLTRIEAYENVFSYRNDSYVKRGFTATGNMAVRADVFRKVGPFGGITSMEDTDWGQRATALGYAVSYIDTAKVLTPACRSFSELKRRWERHVAHEFRSLASGLIPKIGWIARAAAVAVSPLALLPSTLKSRRVPDFRSRWLAFTGLVRIRLTRARLMIGLMLRDKSRTMLESWNREST